MLMTDPIYTLERRKSAFPLYTGSKDKVYYHGGERWSAASIVGREVDPEGSDCVDLDR